MDPRRESKTQPVSMPMEAINSHWRDLMGEWSPGRDPDCTDLWLAYGASIQVALSAANERQRPRREQDGNWVVNQWDAFVDNTHRNLNVGANTLQDEGCVTSHVIGDMTKPLPDSPEPMLDPRDAERVLAEMNELFKEHAPPFVLEEDYDPEVDHDYDYPVGSSPTERGGGRRESSWRMACVEGESLGEVEMEMNDRLGGGGEPESLTVDRDEDLDVYYACTLVRRVAQEAEDGVGVGVMDATPCSKRMADVEQAIIEKDGGDANFHLRKGWSEDGCLTRTESQHISSLISNGEWDRAMKEVKSVWGE